MKIRESLDPVLKPRGFQRKKNTLYVRMVDNLAQQIWLDRASVIYVEPVIQPLFIPDENLGWGFGDRLGHFVSKPNYGIVVETEDTLLSGLEWAVENLLAHGVPWLDQLTTVRSLIDWYAEAGLGGSGPKKFGWGPQCYIFMGYCYAYLGEFHRARELFDRHLDLDLRPEWPLHAATARVLQALKAEPQSVQPMLQGWADENKQRFKLTESG